jgi:hypothetical protein
MAAREIRHNCRERNFGGAKAGLRLHAREYLQLESSSPKKHVVAVVRKINLSLSSRFFL